MSANESAKIGRGDYDDIINMVHFHDPKRPYMSMHDRAGQFSPFKSLSAYHEEIDDAEKVAMEETNLIKKCSLLN